MSKIIELIETGSTNQLVKEYLATGRMGAGDLMMAHHQTASRGRLGKSWSSAPGAGVYCTLAITAPCERDFYHQLTMVIGVAVAQFLEQYTKGYRALLKWPNDIYFAGFGKCSGILCEAVFGKEPKDDRIVIGIGINLSQQRQDFPLDIQNKATSLAIISGKKYTAKEIVVAMHPKLLTAVSHFAEKGFSHFIEEWRRRDMLVGKDMEWCTNSGAIVRGVAETIDETGVLYIRDECGARHQVLSGDVQQAGRF